MIKKFSAKNFKKAFKMHLYLWDWKKEIPCSLHFNNQSWILNQLFFSRFHFDYFFNGVEIFQLRSKYKKKWRHNSLFLPEKDNFQPFKLIMKEKIVKKIGEFRNQDWLLTCDEQDKNRVIVKFADFMIVPKILKYTFQFEI